MRWTQLFIPTLREDPAEAELVSHKLLMRAGYIRKVAAGVYNYLPLMLMVLNKISQIVREEMNRQGAIEMLMPVLVPAELWQESGRWQSFGKELMKMKDRHEHDLILGGTHEEVVTDIVRKTVKSYRQLPLILYQIQNKFRDEIRPRFGLMRGREFIMKDAYSFDRDEAGHKISYQKMVDAYYQIFKRCGLDSIKVESDTGAMGGRMAHEFMVIVDTDGGEDVLLLCDKCDYATNLEMATSIAEEIPQDSHEKPMEVVDTPNAGTVEEVTAYLGVKPTHLVKTLLYKADNDYIAALIRGDRELNETKLKNYLHAITLDICDGVTVAQLTNAPVGFAGPVGLSGVKVVADTEVMKMKNFVVGANQRDKHIVNANVHRDFHVDAVVDIRNAAEGETCPACNKGRLYSRRGIEVGNTFNLGTKYSGSMNAGYLDENGQEKTIIMGSYGVGITRTAQAAVEKFNDDKGIIWPRSIAPFDVIIEPLNFEDKAQQEAALELYDKCAKTNIKALLDDRNERAGVKLNDADLIGVPLRLTIGAKSLKEGKIEFKARSSPEVHLIDQTQAVWTAEEVLAKL
ncbi:MAG TPA: proline--tRNA ligase [candidate division Zixibacteria bacterium]|nr:proline--tRNA ligase [candidate division Zixibacteria bacterium]